MLFFLLSLIDNPDDQEKFITLYHKYKNLMFYEANSLVHDVNYAEDCVQEAFVDIARNFDRVNDVESPQTRNYLLTIVKCYAIKRYNKEHKFASSSLDDIEYEISDDTDVLDEIINQSEQSLLLEAIKNLPEKYRIPLTLKELYNCKSKDIAKLLEINDAAVRKRVQRAKDIIKASLEKEMITCE